MPIQKNNKMLPRAKELRRHMTPQEKKLWYLFLRKFPVKIYKQKIMGSFIVDFYCASANNRGFSCGGVCIRKRRLNIANIYKEDGNGTEKYRCKSAAD